MNQQVRATDEFQHLHHRVGDRWFVDETYVKVGGVWRYVYRAVDQHARDWAAANNVEQPQQPPAPEQATASGQASMTQRIEQAPHSNSVAFDFRDSPVTNSDSPAVKSAAVAFSPLIPSFTLIDLVLTRPFIWQ